MGNYDNNRMEEFKKQDWVKEQNNKNKIILNEWRKEENVRSTISRANKENIKTIR